MVRFRRGSNEYEGKLVKPLGEIQTWRVDQPRLGLVYVPEKHIVAAVRYVLTEGERVALGRFAGLTEPTRGSALGVSGTTLRSLADRGLVDRAEEGIGGRVLWLLTKEGKRVAAGD